MNFRRQKYTVTYIVPGSYFSSGVGYMAAQYKVVSLCTGMYLLPVVTDTSTTVTSCTSEHLVLNVYYRYEDI